MNISHNVRYDRTVSDKYINNGMPRNETFLSGTKGPWLVTGGFRALDMAGPLWFDIPENIETLVVKMDENSDHGELVVYKRVVFIQTNYSRFYLKNHQAENQEPLQTIWRDYYFAAFYASIRHILSKGGSTIVLNNPAIGNGWPLGMWGLFCEATKQMTESTQGNILVADLADLPHTEWADCNDFNGHALGPILTDTVINRANKATQVKFWPRTSQSGCRN